MKTVEGGVTAPAGYTASGVAVQIKAGSSKKDCALVVSATPASVAGTFTKNRMKAPPVKWNVGVCATGIARAVFINSGNANACTGERGEQDTAATAARVAEKLGADTGEVCVCSTGVIGVPLPMDRIFQGVDETVAALTPHGSGSAAQAMMTTDTEPKEMAVEVALTGGTVRMGAIAKGSGMISPNMATMICIVTTDAAVEPKTLSDMLHRAVNVSFNCICVDNDMSTSDTVLCFANGQAGLAAIEPGTADAEAFEQALTELCVAMAQWLVKDGEGATKFVEIAVSGAANEDDAKTIARAIAHSQLCKTAFFGEDPNWGRIACAVGYAGIDVDPAKLALSLSDVRLVENGQAAQYDEKDAAAVMQQKQFTIRVSVGDGPGAAVFWTSDLSHEYVRINADYRS